LANHPSLQRLDLSENEMTGPLPSNLGSSSALSDLSLYNNEFTGSIPLTILQNMNLEYLDMENNLFSGTLPPLESPKIILLWLGP
jgi:Leucine-rich repeat (LRR) protein